MAADAVEDFGLAAQIELGGGLIEQNHTRTNRTAPRGGGRAPPAATGRRRLGPSLIPTSKHGVEIGQTRRAGLTGAITDDIIGRALGATLSRSGSSKRMKSWKTAASRDRQPSRSISRRSMPSTSMAPGLGVVEPAEQLGQTSSSAGFRSVPRWPATTRRGWSDQARRAPARPWPGRRTDVAKADLPPGTPDAARLPRTSAPAGSMLSLGAEPPPREPVAIEGPRQSAKGDQAGGQGRGRDK